MLDSKKDLKEEEPVIAGLDLTDEMENMDKMFATEYGEEGEEEEEE